MAGVEGEGLAQARAGAVDAAEGLVGHGLDVEGLRGSVAAQGGGALGQLQGGLRVAELGSAGAAQERGEQLGEDSAETPSSENVVEQLASFEAFRAFRRSLEDDRERLDDRDPMALAIDHLGDLEKGDLTISVLAKTAGVDRGRVGLAVRVLKTRLEDLLRGEDPV